jgi:hypothetical protein
VSAAAVTGGSNDVGLIVAGAALLWIVLHWSYRGGGKGGGGKGGRGGGKR